MRRQLLQSVQAIPYGADGAPVIDRAGYLSAILGVQVGAVTGSPTAAILAVSIQHSDTADGDFTELTDPMCFIGENPGAVESNRLYNVDIDLLSCKRYVKLSASVVFEGGTNPSASLSCALVLGDKTSNPV